MIRLMIVLSGGVLLASCGSKTGGTGGSSSDIRVVGSSTVYPFTKASPKTSCAPIRAINVTVEFDRHRRRNEIVLRGRRRPISRTSRTLRAQIKKSEYDSCVKNGVKTIIEVPVGIDGLTIIEANNGPAMNLTQADIYKALAANPFGKGPNKAQTWKRRESVAAGGEDPRPRPAADLGHARQPRRPLPDQGLRHAIRRWPRSPRAMRTSTSRSAPRSARTAPMSKRARTTICSCRRSAADPGTLGVLGYSYLEQNADKVRAGEDRRRRRRPKETIADLSYPGARKLYIYVKGEHMTAKPKLRDLVAQYAKMWGKGGPLERAGLVPFGGADVDRGRGPVDRAQAARSRAA